MTVSPMPGRLMLAILNVRGSYLSDCEDSADDDAVTDTLQWWIAKPTAWRIRTYALDRDIHTHFLTTSPNLEQLAIGWTWKHYGDIVRRLNVFPVADATDRGAVEAMFREAHLAPHFDLAPNFLFWKPEDARYRTQSTPA